MRLKYLQTYFRFWFGAIWAAVGTCFLILIVTLARAERDIDLRSTSCILGLAGAMLFAGIGWSLVVSAVRQSGRRVALLRDGTIAAGTVLGLEAIQNLRINRRNPVYLRVVYRDELGHSHHVESACLPPRLIHRWQAGDAIGVVYDPFDPARGEVDIFEARGA